MSDQATNHILRTAKLGGPLTAKLTLNLAGSPAQINGTVSGTNDDVPWVASLVAFRATNDGSMEYTMVLAPAAFAQPDAPSGYGYLLIAKHTGTLTLSGTLADGTAVIQTVPMTEAGTVPVYASLYANTGLLTGWITLTNSELSGNLDWIKKAALRPLLYPKGFTNLLVGQGTGWTNRSPAAAIDLTNGQLNISGGILLPLLSFDVDLSAKNTLTKMTGASTSTNSMSGSINPKTGLLTITFGNGAGKATTVGKAAVLQDTTNAAGYFLDKTNSGLIILQP